ncbi:hypothetical protein [Streptomyces yaizuensis]|uniref:Uncharacterized protein n=1 Tax=Streptomyces yaizuensis TaxID=2989713 RepID=A0ABQ5P469_9ACTN|nr:hypothetical protein [Streptomyces sp. YSPA8]GLF97280.1 hypothetical protein SYYSPA8_23305 [Streptomyces sp. YSPA8]
MARPWEADPSARLVRRLGRSPRELGTTEDKDGCPDIWELDNGDIAVIGRDLTDVYRDHLPEDASIAADERLVVIPGRTLRAAGPDIADA